MIRYLTLEEVLELHRRVLEQSGGLAGVPHERSTNLAAIAGNAPEGLLSIRGVGRAAMSDSVRDLLQVFDALPPSEQHEMAAEILRRCIPRNGIPDTALDELAAELFRGYDAEEDGGGAAYPR
jgi:hypothetical protein